jgi:hypothetical protein
VGIRGGMDVSTVAQISSAVINAVFVVVLGVGYYFLFKSNREMLQEMRAQRTAMGRPQVIVDGDYDSLPDVNLVVRNVSEGAATDITFDFSAPIESSNGFVVSDLPYFKNGMDFLPPNGEVCCYWDHLDDLIPVLREKGLESGIKVTTRYRDLAGESYETTWTLNPSIYKESRFVKHKGMTDLVNAVEELARSRDGTNKEG